MSWKAALQVGAASNKVRRFSARLLPFAWGGLGAIVLGALLAKWTWVLFAPREISVVAPGEQGAVVEADKLFGAAASGVNAQLVALPNVRLAGVFAGSPGFAILELDGKRQVGLPVGGEIVQGVKLLEIAADHVVVQGGGGRQRIDLEMKGAAGGITGIPAAATPLPAGAANNGKVETPIGQPGMASAAAALDMLPADQREALRRQLMGGMPH